MHIFGRKHPHDRVQVYVYLVRGRWHTIEQRVADDSSGLLWVDGKRVR